MKNKKTLFKVSSTALALSIGFTALAPAALAAEEDGYKNPIDSNLILNKSIVDIQTNDLFKKLNKEKQNEFIELAKELNLTYQEQIQFLQEKEASKNQLTARWKTAIIKKAAKLLAAKIGSKSVADITDYLFEWENDLQTGMENYLVYKLGWNRTAAHWTAKSVMFILF